MDINWSQHLLDLYGIAFFAVLALVPLFVIIRVTRFGARSVRKTVRPSKSRNR